MNQTIDLAHLLNRVANWNAQRYDQVYDVGLFTDLLLEELNETVDAFNDHDYVEALDGLCDVTFVSLGGIWKAIGVPIDEAQGLELAYNEALDFCTMMQNQNLVGPLALVTACINQLKDSSNGPNDVVVLCYTIMLLCFMEAAASLHLDLPRFVEAMHVVCDSNDSKSVKKVAANVKANDNDKGNNFVPPTEGLAKILNSIGVKHVINH